MYGKEFKELRYVGEGNIWEEGQVFHVTDVVSRINSRDKLYVVKPFVYVNQFAKGYFKEETYVVSREELIQDFKLVMEDGGLKDIVLIKPKPLITEEMDDVIIALQKKMIKA